MDNKQVAQILQEAVKDLAESGKSSFEIKPGNVVVNTFPLYIDGQLFLVSVKKGAK